jgi:hypothetical protein
MTALSAVDAKLDEQTAVQRLIDENAVKKVVVDYCHGIDFLDEDLLRSTYWDDATEDHQPFLGNALEYFTWVLEVLRESDWTSHTITNQRIVDLEGDVARTVTYVTSVHGRTDENGNKVLHTVEGRYCDRLERRDGVWRFAHRTFVSTWNNSQPHALAYAPGVLRDSIRSKDDKSYHIP